MSRTQQVNETLLKDIANYISREISVEGCLITITRVECSSDFKSAKIGISVLPEKFFGSALEALRKNNSLISEYLRKKTSFRRIPKFSWYIDETEMHAAEIDKIFDQIANEK